MLAIYQHTTGMKYYALYGALKMLENITKSSSKITYGRFRVKMIRTSHENNLTDDCIVIKIKITPKISGNFKVELYL